MRIFRRNKHTENDPFCGVGIGDKAKDTLTGFTGIVMARTEHMTGCNQIFILPESEKDNEMKDGWWFDIERIEKIADRVVQLDASRTGSDIPAARVTGSKL